MVEVDEGEGNFALIFLLKEQVQQARAGKTLRERLEDDPDCKLTSEQLDAIFDPWSFLGRINVVFERLEQLSFE